MAQTVAEEARRGVDFDELVEKYGEDPGMENNTDGYYFTDDGSMVKEFQDASFALDEGDISDPVKTTHGNQLHAGRNGFGFHSEFRPPIFFIPFTHISRKNLDDEPILILYHNCAQNATLKS